MQQPDWYHVRYFATHADDPAVEWHQITPATQQRLISEHAIGLGWDDDDAADAFRILQKMRDSMEFNAIDIHSEYNMRWHITYERDPAGYMRPGMNHRWAKAPVVLGNHVRLSDAVNEFHEAWKVGAV